MTIRRETYEKIARANQSPIKLKCLRPLTTMERIAVRSAAFSICRYQHQMDKAQGYGQYLAQASASGYIAGVMGGVSIGSPDWWRDLPSVIERYLNRFGCERILESYDKERATTAGRDELHAPR